MAGCKVIRRCCLCARERQSLAVSHEAYREHWTWLSIDELYQAKVSEQCASSEVWIRFGCWYRKGRGQLQFGNCKPFSSSSSASSAWTAIAFKLQCVYALSNAYRFRSMRLRRPILKVILRNVDWMAWMFARAPHKFQKHIFLKKNKHSQMDVATHIVLYSSGFQWIRITHALILVECCRSCTIVNRLITNLDYGRVLEKYDKRKLTHYISYNL